MDRDIDVIRAENEALRAENAELRRLLRKHQWSGLTPSKSGGVCPECCASRRSPDGHRPGCALAITLGLGDNSGVLLPV